MAAGVLIGGFGALALGSASASEASSLWWAWVLAGVGGTIVQVGVIAAGVEWGMQRVRSR